MKFKSSFFYARKILFSKSSLNKNVMGRKSLLGAILCIGISLVPLVSLLVVSEGMIEGMTERIIRLSTQDIQVSFGNSSPCAESEEVFLSASQKIASLPFVRKVYPELRSMNLAGANSMRTGAAVRAVPEDFFTDEYTAKLFEIKEGEALLEKKRGIIISEKMAEILNVKVDQRISLINVNAKQGGKLSPRSFMFTVTGIISCGYQELDQLWAFISIKDGFEVLPKNNADFILGVSTLSPFAAELNLWCDELSDFIYDDADDFNYYDLSLDTWQEINSSQFENFSSTKLLLFLIMILIVLVASVNISSALVMIVMERSHEIGILKAMGATQSGIKASFMLTGLFAGIAGLCLGLPLGLLAAVNINHIILFMEKLLNYISAFFYSLFSDGTFVSFKLLDPAFYIQKIDIIIPFKELYAIAFLTVLISLLVSILPSRRAGKEKIMDTLRKA